MLKDMSSRNRPNFNTDSGLTPNGGRAAGERPGSAPARTARRPPRTSRPALRRFFAPGSAAATEAAPIGSGGLPADIDEPAAALGRPGRAAGVDTVGLAADAVAGVVETEASRWPRTAADPDVEPDAQPARRDHRRVERRADALADVARANPFTPPAGTATTWR